ncbi:MAG: tRNA (guanine-N(1)-)-methyltransferase [Patescibacteria group bacterium]|nr:MAG: tRNA (guanine-N(1)-)-methyltransferase [Patescibacteria group bacterium]
MIIDILTLFPRMFDGPFSQSMLKKAQDIKAVKINIHNIRDWATDKHKTTDDRPFGGGPGMILKVEPIDKALEKIKNKTKAKKRKIILLSPQGKVFDQKMAKSLSKIDHLILIAGHYEGVDQRIIDHLIDEEISIGKYILTGGEIPAMVLVDSIVRLLPGVLEKEVIENESFSKGDELDYPQYTQPRDYKGWKVPEILLSGNHKEIEKWRKEKALEKSRKLK